MDILNLFLLTMSRDYEKHQIDVKITPNIFLTTNLMSNYLFDVIFTPL